MTGASTAPRMSARCINGVTKSCGYRNCLPRESSKRNSTAFGSRKSSGIAWAIELAYFERTRRLQRIVLIVVPPEKESNLKYVFDMKADCNAEEEAQA